MKIGVFDSGKGGEFIAAGLGELLPEHEYLVVNDREHVPYGSRSDEEVTVLTLAAIQPLLAARCDIIVIACNSATMAAIATLRTTYPTVAFVGIEPMVKPAAAISKSGHIAMLATPLTLHSPRYQQLRTQYASTLTVTEPDTTGWAAHIEYDTPDSISFSELNDTVGNGCDVLVLACTHYLALRTRLARAFPNVLILEPTEAIARQITALAARH